MQYNITCRQKDKGWQFIISYKLGEKWKQKSKQGFKNKSLAKIAAQKEVKNLENNLEFINNEYDGITFKDFCDIYIEHVILHLEYNTILLFKASINAFSDISNKKLELISTMDLQKCIDKLLKKGVKPSSLKVYLGKIKTILYSASNQYKVMSPIDFTNLKIIGSKSDTEKKALTLEELNKLLDCIDNIRHKLILAMAGMCGLRYGEILGVTWDCVDFKNSILTINKQWKKTKNGYTFGELKSKNSYRQIPIPNKLHKLLQYYKLNTPYNIDNRILDYQSACTANINHVLKKHNITIHELRHTYATTLIASGVDFKTAAQLLGHDIEQTMKTYSHVNDDMLKYATNIIKNIF